MKEGGRDRYAGGNDCMDVLDAVDVDIGRCGSFGGWDLPLAIALSQSMFIIRSEVGLTKELAETSS